MIAKASKEKQPIAAAAEFAISAEGLCMRPQFQDGFFLDRGMDDRGGRCRGDYKRLVANRLSMETLPSATQRRIRKGMRAKNAIWRRLRPWYLVCLVCLPILTIVYLTIIPWGWQSSSLAYARLTQTLIWLGVVAGVAGALIQMIRRESEAGMLLFRESARHRSTAAFLENGFCPACCYDLSGVPEGDDAFVTCPECGAAWDPARYTLHRESP